MPAGLGYSPATLETLSFVADGVTVLLLNEEDDEDDDEEDNKFDKVYPNTSPDATAIDTFESSHCIDDIVLLLLDNYFIKYIFFLFNTSII